MNAPFDIARQTAAAADATHPGPGLLRFITCGSVDDGKSTLIGRLLYDSQSILDDQLAALDRDSKRFGTQGDALDFALLVDGLAAEREQAITIDVAYRYFATPRRSFIVADTPGHEQYTRNMATGASRAELAIILVDARKGILPQTRRHSLIVSMLGVRSVAIAVNKMDVVGFDRATFDRICSDYRAMARDLGFAQLAFFPISARDGDNVASLSLTTPWFDGPSLLEYLETVEVPASAATGGLLFPVQWINRPNADFRGYAGSIARGSLRRGQEVSILPRGLVSRVARIIDGKGDVEEAFEGQAVTLTLADDIDVSRGDWIVPRGSNLPATRRFDATLLWTGSAPLAPKPYHLRLGSALAQAQVEIDYVVDIQTFTPMADRSLAMNAIARASIVIDRDLMALPYRELRELGGFILVDKQTNETAAFGLVEKSAQDTGEVAPAPATSAAMSRVLRFLAGVTDDAQPLRQKLWELGATLLLSFLLVLVLTRSPLIAISFAVADLILRPFVRRLVQRVTADRAPDADGDLNSWGSGI